MSRDSSEKNKPNQKLFIGGLPKDATEDQLQEIFGQYGSIDNVAIVKDKETQEPRGFGFITFQDFDSVDRCLARNISKLVFC